MRVALISDIHGNDTALDAVLADIEKQEVDSIVCLGDVATILPRPREVLARLRKLDCRCILGNHDAALLDLDAAPRLQIAPPLISSLHWCAGLLAPEDFDFLRSFAPTAELTLSAGTSMLCCHGSPQSNIDMILATTPKNEIEHFFGTHPASILAGGHTHLQMLRRYQHRLLMNPGSVGMPFLDTPLPGKAPTLLPWAEYAILTVTTDDSSIDFRRIEYNVSALLRAISQSDIPIREWLVEQYSTSTK